MSQQDPTAQVPGQAPAEGQAAALNFNMHQLLKLMVDKGASDLHITTASAPQLRIDGKLVPLRTAVMPDTLPTLTMHEAACRVSSGCA